MATLRSQNHPALCAVVSDDAKLITQKARRDKMKYGESKVKINAAIG